VHLGAHSTEAADRVLRVSDLDAFFGGESPWIPAPNDGGASLIQRWGDVRDDLGAQKVRAK